MSTVENIINYAMGQASQKAALADAYAGQAWQAAQGGHVYSFTPAPNVSVNEPNVYLPYRAAGFDRALWDDVYEKIANDLGGKIGDFFVQYYPIDADLMAAVETWQKRAIVDGGTGINATVEVRLWQRDRDRISAQSSSDTEEARAAVAARGFPVPPGALNAIELSIQRKASSDIAAVSRDAAIKAFETEIENVKFAITSAIDSRKAAFGAVGDYLRALALGPQLATELATASGDAQARLISATSSYYNSRISAAEMAMRRGLSIMDAQLRQTVEVGGNKVEYTRMQVNAAIQAMEAMAQQASASLNGINATSQLIESAG